MALGPDRANLVMLWRNSTRSQAGKAGIQIACGTRPRGRSRTEKRARPSSRRAGATTDLASVGQAQTEVTKGNNESRRHPKHDRHLTWAREKLASVGITAAWQQTVRLVAAENAQQRCCLPRKMSSSRRHSQPTSS